MVDQENSLLPIYNLTSQFLKCPLCLANYVNPKMLSCQHTFCLECLKTYIAIKAVRTTLPCPVCREKIEIPGNDVRNVKDNFYIAKLISFVVDSQKKNIQKNEITSSTKTSISKSLSLCGACGESETLATFCQECSLELCNTCTKSHGRVPATSSHGLLTSEQLNMKCKAEAENLKDILTLREHKTTYNHVLLSYCNSQLPVDNADAQERIKSKAEEACQIIRKKTNDLLQKVESFRTEQNEIVRQELTKMVVEKQRFANIREVLESISLSDDGFKNQASLRQVEKYINDYPTIAISPLFDKILYIFFAFMIDP